MSKSARLILAGALSALLLLLLGACSNRPPAPQKVTAEQNGKTITLRPGQEVIILLEANPTTGYAWEVAQVDEGILQQIGETGYTPEATSPGVVGAGGTAAFRFQAVAQGTTTLQLAYRRPWETDKPPATTFTLTVRVRP